MLRRGRQSDLTRLRDRQDETRRKSISASSRHIMGYLLLLYESGTLTGSLNITGCVEQPESGLRITRAAMVETSIDLFRADISQVKLKYW